DFQNHVIRTLGLKGIGAIHGRIQDREILEGLGGRFDGVIARAFSDLDTLLLLSFPFLRRGGVVLAMRGEAPEEEWQHLTQIKTTRYQFRKTTTFSLPFSSIKRSILLFEKL
ncbi:MAG: class I SAM-dependent methyltransferase, partial [Desulfobacterales bacterium]|nr:class I SAM-dependent methyltransferase [Desulfobacterales bacterium]